MCVLGNQIKRELFGNEQAVGQWVRLGDRRFRVIGVLAEQGESMGMRTDELVIIPVASAHQLFNTSGTVPRADRGEEPRCHRTGQARCRADHVPAPQRREGRDGDHAGCGARHLRPHTHRADDGRRRHRRDQPGRGGRADHERDADRRGAARQGDRPAQGAGRAAAQIRELFFAEAALLSAIGSVVGLVLGYAGSIIIGQIYPTLPVCSPWWAVLAACGTALGTGILFSVWPARRAARLDPVAALARR